MDEKIYGLFISTLILAGCNQQPEAIEKIEPQTPISSEEECEKTETIPFMVKLTEFSTGKVLADQAVTLQTAEGELLSTMSTNDQGAATFENVEVGKQLNVLLESPIMKLSRSFIVDEKNNELLIETYTRSEVISVPIIMQEPELPTGCEITSLTAILNYCGEPVTKRRMARDYLKKAPLRIEGDKLVGPEPSGCLYRSPNFSKGVYAFPQAIVKTVKNYVTAVNKEFVVTDLSGSTGLEIEQYITSGVPVLMWITRELEALIANNRWWIEGTVV